MIKTLLNLSEEELQNEVKRPTVLRLYPALNSRGVDGIEILWAPFDYINRDAQLAIVGVTPGPEQAMRSYKAVRNAIARGEEPQESLARIKAEASFRGKVMEANLMSVLEHSGVAERAGIDNIDRLWTDEAHKVHFTSTIRYPTFINRDLYNNQIDSLTHSELKRYVEEYLAEELSLLPATAVIVALGSKGPRIVRHAAKVAGVDSARVVALPHPSGSATGAVRAFLSERRTKSIRPCRCMLCDRSRIPFGWDLSSRFSTHDRTHRKVSPHGA
jgi:Uracil DNA glycosylase superfamily